MSDWDDVLSSDSKPGRTRPARPRPQSSRGTSRSATTRMSTGRGALMIGLLVSGAFLIGSVVFTAGTIANIDAERTELEASMVSVSEEISEIEAVQGAAREQGYRQYFDVVSDRHERDVKSLTSAVRDIADWKNQAEYVAGRKALMKDLNLTEESGLLQSFMPPPPVNTDGSGEVFSQIDLMGLNAKSSKVKVEPVAQRGDLRTYLVTFTMTSSSSTGGTATSSAELAMVVTLNADGVAVSAHGAPLQQEPITSDDV